MHDHGESGGASQQMVKGDQTLAFARHDPTTRPPTGDATTQQVRAWTAMALGRQPLLHPWPHTSPAPKRIRKARRTRGRRRSTAFRKRRFVSCIGTCVQYFFSQEKKGRGGKKNSYQFKNWRITSPTKPLGSCHLSTRKDQEQVHR